LPRSLSQLAPITLKIESKVSRISSHKAKLPTEETIERPVEQVLGDETP